MARQVVAGFSGEFRHGDYSDESREKISGLIESRLAGTAKAATAGNPGEEKLMSLMEALQMTISQKAG
jgi:non-homologous end joining protein Ku